MESASNGLAARELYLVVRGAVHQLCEVLRTRCIPAGMRIGLSMEYVSRLEVAQVSQRVGALRKQGRLQLTPLYSGG